MALPTLVYASTGSNTAASGAGPATAVTGSSATASGTTVTVNAGTDISGVATDGSAVLWFNSAAGARHLSKITGSSGSGGATPQFTIEDSVTIAAVSWAVGGKRLSLNADTSQADVEDAKPGWTFELEVGTYDVPTASMLMAAGTASGLIVVQGKAGDTVTLRSTGNFAQFTGNIGNKLKNLNFTTNSGTTTSCYAANGLGTGSIVEGCTVTGLRRGFLLDSPECITFIGTEISGCTDEGILNAGGGRCKMHIIGCYIHGNGGDGVASASSSNITSTSIIASVITGNGGSGIQIDSTGGHLLVHGCVIHGNTSDGITMVGSIATTTTLSITSNMITSNGGYGINAVSGTSLLGPFIDSNAFRSNTSGQTNNVTGTNSVTLTADPYVNAAGGDYSLNTTAGGGVLCKDTGYPQTVRGSATPAKTDIGVAQGVAYRGAARAFARGLG